MDLSTHILAKIPHHGSLGSLDECLFNSARQQTWVVTPFNKGSRLPSFENGQGVDFLLKANRKFLLTGMPKQNVVQPPSGTVCTVTPPEAATKPAPFSLPGLEGVDVTPAKGEIANYFIMSVDRDGDVDIVANGEGTVLVTRSSDPEDMEPETR